MSDKEQATRLADALELCTEFDPLFPAAAALLRRWPDGEPFCYLRQTSSERNPPHGWAVYCSGQIGDVPLYTAPPAESERIAALEALIEQARVALRDARASLDGRGHNAGIIAHVDAAMRKIKEVRK